jgi:hypothetical protein
MRCGSGHHAVTQESRSVASKPIHERFICFPPSDVLPHASVFGSRSISEDDPVQIAAMTKLALVPYHPPGLTHYRFFEHTLTPILSFLCNIYKLS